jgi:alpha-L-rhamnosidase
MMSVGLPAVGTEGPQAPSHLRCEYLTDPIGIDVPAPRFYWVLEHSQRGERQSAYQILVSGRLESLNRDQGDQWDTGQVMSSESTQVVYSGKPLESGHTYYWKVRYWDNEKRAGNYSAPARFEMGLLSRQEWSGKWITGNELRRAFRLDRKVARARAYVTALGYYELRINGDKVGDRMLDPAWTTYPKRVLYSTYDVTRALTAEENAVGVTLGDGWAALGHG